MLGGVEVAALQRQAGQRTQVVHGEKVLADAQPPGLGFGGRGGVGGRPQVPGFQPGQRPRTGYQHLLDRLGKLCRRQRRRGFTLDRLVVLEPGADVLEDQRDGGVPFVLELRPLLYGPGREGFGLGLGRLAGQHAAQCPRPGPPGRQPGVGRDRRLDALQQVKVLAATDRVPRQQQVSGQAQKPVGGIQQQQRVDHAQIRRWRQRTVPLEAGEDPVLQQGQRPVGLLRLQEMARRAPHVTR